MSVMTGQVVKLQRSSAYWAGRAARHRREGDRRRAAALLRHAMALSPTDGSLKMEYARTLQEMECYEASNRAAFGALTIDPSGYDAYGLIGRNMMALGHQQEAMDAFSRYLWAVKRSGGILDYDADLDVLEQSQVGQGALRARYETLMDIAGRRISRGDEAGAEKALALAKPAQEIDERYDSLQALLWQMKGNTKAALESAERACERNPYSARAYCTLATAYGHAGKRTRAASALLRAAALCQSAQDELLQCYAAINLDFPELALPVLRRALKRNPDRLSAAYNLAVVLLKLGRMEEAQAYIHRSRDLDPVDVPSRCIGRSVEQWQELDLTPTQVRKASKTMPLYPLLSPVQRADCLAQLASALGEGLEAFCDRLQVDDHLYNTLLYELADPDHQLGRLIPTIAELMPPDFAERMLREILVQSTPDDRVKRYAAAALMTLGAKPPFVVWHAGRIAEIDPSIQSGRESSFSRLMLLRRLVNILQKTADSRLMTHALHLLHVMGGRRRNAIIRDADRVFRAALEQHYLLSYGLPDNEHLRELLKYTADERRRVRQAFRLFCKLVPLPEPTVTE